METCSLFNRQTVWKIVLKLVKGKTCIQKWSLIILINPEETPLAKVVWLQPPQLSGKIRLPRRTDQVIPVMSLLTLATVAAQTITFLEVIRVTKVSAIEKKRLQIKITSTRQGGKRPSKTLMPCSLEPPMISWSKNPKQPVKRKILTISPFLTRKTRLQKTKVKVT